MFKKIRVTEGNKALDVYVPKTNDRSEAKDLEDFAIGKTKEDFKNKEIFNRNKPKVDPAEAKAILKEAQDYARRKSESVNKKYF
jgi:predicted Zn-dependent protease